MTSFDAFSSAGAGFSGNPLYSHGQLPVIYGRGRRRYGAVTDNGAITLLPESPIKAT